MKLNDRQALQLLRTRINAALAGLGTELDVTFDAANCSFDPLGNTCTYKLNVAVKRADGTVVTKEAEDFKRFAALEGLQPSDLGRRFASNGGQFEVCGYAPRSYKRPILAKDVRTGRIFKFTSDTVRRHFGVHSPTLVGG